MENHSGVPIRSKPKTQARILVATRDSAYGAVLQRQLEMDGAHIERCHDAQGVLRLTNRRDFEIVILDLALSPEGGVDLVSFIRQQRPQAQIVLLFEPSAVDRAVEGIRKGAYFYLPVGSEPRDVALVANKALRHLRTRAAADRFEQRVFEEMLGATPAMKRVIEVISKVAPTDSTVLLLGESGTGKDLLANTIHRLSARSEKPFVAVNCAALPEALLESELFGHVKGAFTGADSDKRGLFEEADGGAIFLDEIGDMALVTQAKLLRVLQNGEIRPVGSTLTKRVDVRIIAATNKNLEEAVREKRFREDLYFRLNVVQIRIPPLRERLDALPRLVAYFMGRYSEHYGKAVTRIDEQAQALLTNYAFPGNVRELESVIAHAVIMCDGDTIRARDLPDYVQGGRAPVLALPHYAADDIPPLEEMEARLIRMALERLDGNQTEAAKRLGISRSTLWRKMKQYGIAGEKE